MSKIKTRRCAMEFNEALLTELRLLREAVEQVADTLEEISDQLNDLVMEDILLIDEEEYLDEDEDLDEDFDEDLEEDAVEVEGD